MMPGITLTGADERVPISGLAKLAALSPSVEFGLLYTETPEGRNRYPGKEWLQEAVSTLGRQCAIHFCGSKARALGLEGLDWVRGAGRVQVNGNISPVQLCSYLEHYRVVITQYHGNMEWDPTQLNDDGHQLLVDASGGRGIKPEGWERPITDKPVGFAGGLGPGNLERELPRIAAVAQDWWWIDAEGRLRDEGDWFSVARAEVVIDIFLEWCNG